MHIGSNKNIKSQTLISPFFIICAKINSQSFQTFFVLFNIEQVTSLFIMVKTFCRITCTISHKTI